MPMNEILIYGPIGMGFGKTAEEIRAELSDAGGDAVHVRINSAGGSFDEGPAIFNALTAYDGPVSTEIDGIAYSMAAVILQAGKTRYMAENAVLMVHGAQYFAEGSAEEMRKTAEMMDAHNEAMVTAFTGRGIDEKTVRGWLTDGEDHYFNANEALEAGLIDEVTPAIDMAAAVTHIPKFVSLPPTLAAYRSKTEETQMPDTKAPKTETPDVQASGKIDVQAFSAERSKNIKQGEQQGAAGENRRQLEIRAMFDKPQFADPVYTDLRDECLRNMQTTPEMARVALIDAIGNGIAPAVTPNATQSDTGGMFATQDKPRMGRPAEPGKDVGEKYIEGVTAALSVQSGVITDREEIRKAREGNEFVSMTVYEMARRYLDRNGINVMGSNREQIIGQAMVTAAGIAHSTSDFANILENVANKALMAGWDEAPETWNQWARTGTLPDFKPGSRVNLSTFGDLDMVYENGEYKYGSFSDLKETLQLATYGKLFGISRQALANDDLSALSAIPRSMGRAAARKIGDLAYNVLISNPTLNQDNTAVFDATHNNIGTAGPPATAPGGTLDEAWTAMGTQTDPAGNTLNISPEYLIVPKALEISTAAAVRDATYADSNAAQERTNPFRDRFMVIADARLDVASTTAWYALASGTMHDTVEVAFLNGQQSPYLEAQDGWRVDGVEYKVRIDAVAAALDFRTMFYNAGA
jgi:ATP-dependent protease ClpP protease subunit